MKLLSVTPPLKPDVSALLTGSIFPSVSVLDKVSILCGILVTLRAVRFCRHMLTHAPVPSPLRNHIRAIFGVSSKPEVRGINAHSIVGGGGAIVKNKHPFRDFSNIYYPRNAVRGFRRATVLAVSVISRLPLPNPASIGFVNLTPKQFFVHWCNHTKYCGVTL